MQLSLQGSWMARPSGISLILDDIARAVASGGDWLNLSAGNPARIPEVTRFWQQQYEGAVARDFAGTCCQYGPARGSDHLVDAIVSYFRQRYQWEICADNVIVGPGSQLLCFIAAAAFTGRSGHTSRPIVLPSVPEYTGYQGLPLGDGGVLGTDSTIEQLGQRRFRYVLDVDAVRRQQQMGMLLLSSPANPTGRDISADEQSALADIAAERDIPLVIDHAYGQPFPLISDCATPPVFHPHVINCFTFSKIGIPGERLGFAIGPPAAIAAMVAFLANCALHAPRLPQAVATRALESGQLDALARTFITPYYRAKRLLAEDLLGQYLPASVSWHLHSGAGGMFCWLWIDEPWFDDLEFTGALRRRKVLVVPGRYFFVPDRHSPARQAHETQCFRISLSVDDAAMAEGIRQIGAALREVESAQHVSRISASSRSV